MKTFEDGTLTVNVCHLTQFAAFSVDTDVTSNVQIAVKTN
jgi:hypothetical protein